MSSAYIFTNVTANVTEDAAQSPPLVGWRSGGLDRGTGDILWAACFTIILCVWVTTHPNSPSPNDKWYHQFQDKFHLASLGLLGPDFLFAIAIGQLASAARSVQLFKADAHLFNDFKWTYRHGFFVDMGGIHLKTPDFPQGFPIAADQLHYLVKQGHVDFPNMEEMGIDERSSADTLSRLITVWQGLWFTVAELQRVKQGLPMTALELTALWNVFMMVATSICWARKPSPMRPRFIHTKDGKTAEDIRQAARLSTHPDLPIQWYRTPVDFAGSHRWQFGAIWDFYMRISQVIRTPVSRPVQAYLWDRFPSDAIGPVDPWLWPVIVFVGLVFSASFMTSWGFQFPTEAEHVIWRCAMVSQTLFTLYGMCHLLLELFRWDRRRRVGRPVMKPAKPVMKRAVLYLLPGPVVAPPEKTERRLLSRLLYPARRLRNLSHNQDPGQNMPLRLSVPLTFFSMLYAFCRVFLYFEDFFSLRAQPEGVYVTVNRYLPFLNT